MQEHLPSLVHLKHLGFVLGKEARDNILKALNQIHLANTSKTSWVFLGTDTEKAFDRVNWKFIFLVWVWETIC